MIAILVHACTLTYGQFANMEKMAIMQRKKDSNSQYSDNKILMINRM